MSRLTLDQVTAFLSVVRSGGVTRAAQALNLSQPAVTARLKNLETVLSRSLFERSTAGLRLTKEGEIFLQYAERFETLGMLVEKNVIEDSAIEGFLRLGASETVTQCWLPDFVSRLYQRFPKLQVEINVDISVNLRSGLLEREIDLALLLGPISEFSVDNTPLPPLDMAWYAAADLPCPDEGPAGFLRRPVISYHRQTRPYRELRAALLEAVGPGARIFPSTSLSACFRLVEAGIGVAALPRALGRAHVAQGAIREFDPGWVPRPLEFTASYLGDPAGHMIRTAAALAREVALEHAALETVQTGAKDHPKN